MPIGNASDLHDAQFLVDLMWIKLVNLLGKEVKVGFLALAKCL